MHIIYRNTENHHVTICIGDMVNAAVIHDNFDHVFIAVYIIILPLIFVKIMYFIFVYLISMSQIVFST